MTSGAMGQGCPAGSKQDLFGEPPLSENVTSNALGRLHLNHSTRNTA